LKRLNEYQGECESSEVGHFSVRKKLDVGLVLLRHYLNLQLIYLNLF